MHAAANANAGAAPSSNASAAATNSAAMLTPPTPALQHAPVRPAREKQRLHETFQDDRRYLEQMFALDKNARSERVDAILELKGSLGSSAARLQAQNATLHQRAQELADREKRAYSELLNQGKNPHEVARARAVKLAADKERRGIEHRIERKQVDILERLEVERVVQRRRERLEQEKLAFEKKYQAEMGRSAVEARTKAYLLSRTGKEQLDPTGKLVRMYPSQETTLKDHSFGLGHNLVHDAAQRRVIVDKVHAKSFHHDAVASTLLLPRQPSAVGDDERSSSRDRSDDATAVKSSSNNRSCDRNTATPLSGASVAALSGPSLPIPGRDLRELNHKLAPTNSADLLPPIHAGAAIGSGDGEQPGASMKKGFGKPKRSVLEQQMLADARERQRVNIFQKQVVWGKEFKGDAFLADPPVLWFKDFDVGEPLALTFMLTNVSNTFNHFKLAAMDADVRELFDVVYDKPGRMSAGMACSLRMTFTATAPVDLETFLPVVTQTGAFRIAVKCTCKKAVPVLLQRAVAFRDVVIGEKQMIAVVLENRGALPLHFHVARHAEELQDELDASASARGPEVDDLGEGGGGGDNEANDKVASPQDPQAASLAPSTNAASLHERDTKSDAADRGNSSPESLNDEFDEAVAAADDSHNEDQAESHADGTANTLAALSRAAAMASSSVTCDADTLLDAEQAILDHAMSFTVYKPEGADTPLRHTKRGVVAPYSSALITFTFTPAAPMQLTNQVFAVAFAQERSSTGKRKSATVTSAAATPSITALTPSSIIVSAESTQVPIFTAESTLYFGCCVYEKLYRHQLVVCNRGKVALKIQVRVPKALADIVEFTPSMGYVQAAAVTVTSSSNITSDDAVSANAGSVGTFVIQIKFRPRRSMWRRVERKGFGSEALGFVAVPVQVFVPDQVVPVLFVLAARLTPSGLAFSADSIDFGACALGHSVFETVTIENTARVPQHVGFVRLPQEVCVADSSDGVGATLLPYEKKTLKLVYQPSTATPFRAKLRVRTSLNQEYWLPCAGSCVATPLVLSHSCVRFGATQTGQSQVFSLLCSNVSERPQSFELLPPEGSQAFLCIAPLVSRIEPNSSVRIEIVFAPTDAIFEAAYANVAVTTGAQADAVVEVADGSVAVAERCQSQDTSADAEPADSQLTPDTVVPVSDSLLLVNSSKTSPVPGLRDSLFVLGSRDAVISESELWRLGIPAEERSVHHIWTVLGFRRDESSQASSNSASTAGPLLSLQIETTAVEPKVLAAPHRLDYKQVAIGQSLIIELTLSNTSTTSDVELSAKPLHVLGGFRMVNSLRPMRKRGGVHVVRMEFKPQSPIIYEDELELSSPAIGTLRIPLRGEGINPSLSFTPANGWLDFRDTLARNKSVLELVLANASAFPLTFAIVEWPERGAAAVSVAMVDAFTAHGLAPFTFAPCAATIPAQGSLVVKVVFSPALQRPEHYKQQFRIKVPNESEQHVLTLSGRCWENQLYAFSPALLDLSPLTSTSTRAGAAQSGGSAGVAPALRAPPLVEDLFELPPGVSTSSLATSGLLNAGLRKPQPTLVLTFDDDDAGEGGSDGIESNTAATAASGHVLAHELVLGSTLPPSDDETHVSPSGGATSSKAAASTGSSATAAGSFELVLIEHATHPEYAKLFSLEPMKGSLAAGQQTHVQVTFSPPPPLLSSSSTAVVGSSGDHDAADAAFVGKHKELVVTQWIEVQATCTLRGGFLWCPVPQTQAHASSSSGSAQLTSGSKASTGVSDSEVAAPRTVQITLRAKLRT